METRIYLKKLQSYNNAIESTKRIMGKNPYYDLEKIAEPIMAEQFRQFIEYRSERMSISTMFSERTFFNQICRFLKDKNGGVKSFLDKSPDIWIRQFKGWMLENGLSLTTKGKSLYGGCISKALIIGYFERLLDFHQPMDEVEKDIWKLEKLDIDVRQSLVKNRKTLNFTKILQQEFKEEVKKAAYLNLKSEALSTVANEMIAVCRISKFLKDRHPAVKSSSEINREIMEEYLTYLKLESGHIKNLHSDVSALRSMLETIGKIYKYEHLESLILNRDIPRALRAEFKTYSDGELKRLNSALTKLDEQIARAMLIHQMLGTRISDTLTLRVDCLYEKNGENFIWIKQMKTNAFEKPISLDLVSLIKSAIEYTRKKYGNTIYIFVDDNDKNRSLQYDHLQYKVIKLIYAEDLRDDAGNLFGFGTHMYRHLYGLRLTEMHLDDWTIAKLLGHNNVRNVRYYRKMSNQVMADETRKIRDMLSQIILDNLDGWGEEYEQIRYDDSLE